MYLKYKQLWNNLTRLQRVVIFLTTFAGPMSFDLAQGLYATGLCGSCVNYGMLIVYVVWWQLAMLVISISTLEDNTKVANKFKKISSEFSEGIDQLSEDLEEMIMVNRDRLGDLNNWASNVRGVVLEELRVDLPAVPVTLRAKGLNFGFTTSEATLNVSKPSSRLLRIRGWIWRRLLFCRRLIHKVFYNWDGDQANRR